MLVWGSAPACRALRHSCNWSWAAWHTPLTPKGVSLAAQSTLPRLCVTKCDGLWNLLAGTGSDTPPAHDSCAKKLQAEVQHISVWAYHRRLCITAAVCRAAMSVHDGLTQLLHHQAARGKPQAGPLTQVRGTDIACADVSWGCVLGALLQVCRGQLLADS